jgi:hypothetical protein
VNSTYLPEAAAAQRRDVRAQAVSLIGPLVSVSGLVWAILQPYRVTLLHPRHQGVWWLIAEPPLLLAAVGAVFAVVVARPLLADLEEHRATGR